MTKGFLGNDERVKHDSRTQSRGERSIQDESRTLNDGTAFTIEERRKMLRNDWKQEFLPNPPKLSGYHFCWLSTESKMDPIHNRIRQGYEPVKISELPGMEKFTMKDGDFAGYVSCNEMVLFKIPEELYQLHMSVFHHEIPLEHEQGIRENVESNNLIDSTISPHEINGFKDMGAQCAAPHFN